MTDAAPSAQIGHGEAVPPARASTSNGVNLRRQESDPKRAKFPLAEQAEEANRILTQRYKTCEARAKAGDMTREAADHDIAIVRAIRDTMLLFAEFEDEVRATVAYCLEQRRLAAEAAELRKNDTVKAVLDVVGHDAEVGLPSAEPADDPDQMPFDLPQAEEAEAA